MHSENLSPKDSSAPQSETTPIVRQAHNDEQVIMLWLHGRSRHTQKAYSSDIVRFFKFVNKQLMLITLGDLQNFADTLTGENLKPASQNRTLAAVKSLITFAHKIGISGVQPKLSVRLEGNKLLPVARDGQYILKPQTQEFTELPQNEYLCMQMGNQFGLNTAHSLLLELADGSPAYLVKRFDRFKKGNHMEKLACEDTHQIIGGPNKYAGSHEQIAKIICNYCSFAPLELQRFYEMAIFNFAIGNGDAHRKNFSLLTNQKGIVALSPAYDLVSSRLVIPEEAEEMALTVNGKRNRLKRDDFLTFAESIGLEINYAESKIGELLALANEFTNMVTKSALTAYLQERFLEIITQRLGRLRE